MRYLLLLFLSVNLFAVEGEGFAYCYDVPVTTPYHKDYVYSEFTHSNNNLDEAISMSGKYWDTTAVPSEENTHYYRTGQVFTLLYQESTYTWRYAKETETVYCVAPDYCDANQTYNPNTNTCDNVPDCTVPNSSYDWASEGCKCDAGYLPNYGFEGLQSCDLPECPPIYEEHQPPLPLFAQVAWPTECNFFPYGDNAVATLIPNVRYCCYGQENTDNNSSCGTNEIDIGGNCYPIEDNDDNSTDPKTCEKGSHWSASANQCLPDDTSFINDLNGTMTNTNPDYNGTTSGFLPSDADKSAFEDVSNFDGVKDAMTDILSSYVLIQLPVNVGGTCTQELTQTFTFMGHSYTWNLSPYLQPLNDYLPIFKGLIIFMFAFGGVLIVLASGRSS